MASLLSLQRRVGFKIAEQQLKAISDGDLAGAISVFKPQNLLRTTITANLFKVKTEKFNLKGIAKVVAREKAKNAVYSIVENTVLQKKDKKKEKQELQKQQEQIKQHDAKVTQFAKENNLTHLSHWRTKEQVLRESWKRSKLRKHCR
nr:hypothetical protein [Mycoplasmopsis bovis]